ncbi:MAG TPA: nitroreductase family deazaflavin-dependent oxidoreductase [Anaerolineales bacterium]|nr:nitroreductase family deazaflavin-dependent oxidoreductase [Anaerolineales bacterium]HLO29997.1 nitroreductase family deazaflavin-dependent oxidoreductase [Anaerolineales bacterium]
MKDALIKWFMRSNAFLIRITNGRIGSKLGTQTILLLETIGRKSGQPRVIPIAYFLHEGKYLIVESNWGKDRHADWYLNLLNNPHAALQVNGRTIQVEAHDAQGEEYSRLWKFATERHPPYLRYQEMTKRRIPIVVFQPIGS